MTYFELYNLPISFQPDQRQIRQKFFELSRKYHPDFYTQEDQSEQAEALDMSAQVNKAYKTFQNQDETIKYLLQLKSLLEEEEKYQLPPGFLMEMMELNEQMTEAKTEADPQAVTDLKKAIADTQQEIYEPVKKIMEQYAEGKTTTEDLLKVKEYYFKKKYLNRILAALQ